MIALAFSSFPPLSGWFATIPARYAFLTSALASFAPGFTPKISQANFGFAPARVNIRAHAVGIAPLAFRGVTVLGVGVGFGAGAAFGFPAATSPVFKSTLLSAPHVNRS